MENFTYNGKNSFDDFGVYISEINVQMPELKEVRETVPYMDGDYNFTNLSGRPHFERRKVEITVKIVSETDNIADMWQKRTDIVSWVTSQNGGALEISNMNGWQFEDGYAQFDTGAYSRKNNHEAYLTIIFDVAPFMARGEEFSMYSFKPNSNAYRAVVHGYTVDGAPRFDFAGLERSAALTIISASDSAAEVSIEKAATLTGYYAIPKFSGVATACTAVAQTGGGGAVLREDSEYFYCSYSGSPASARFRLTTTQTLTETMTQNAKAYYCLQAITVKKAGISLTDVHLKASNSFTLKLNGAGIPSTQHFNIGDYDTWEIGGISGVKVTVYHGTREEGVL